MQFNEYAGAGELQTPYRIGKGVFKLPWYRQILGNVATLPRYCIKDPAWVGNLTVLPYGTVSGSIEAKFGFARKRGC